MLERTKRYPPASIFQKSLFRIKISLQISVKRLERDHSIRGHPANRERIIVLVRFFHLDVARFLEFANLHAQVARRSAGFFFQNTELRLARHHEVRHDRKTQLRQKQGVKFFIHGVVAIEHSTDSRE